MKFDEEVNYIFKLYLQNNYLKVFKHEVAVINSLLLLHFRCQGVRELDLFVFPA